MTGTRQQINLGTWSRDGIEQMLRAGAGLEQGARIDFLSRQFLGVPYGESTLVGSAEVPEMFVINLGTVDCFTYLDYIEAMRLSGSFAVFRQQLKRVRYRKSRVAFRARNHFFTDWAQSKRVKDVTGQIGREHVAKVDKSLNKKGEYLYLPGIDIVSRTISYIPSRFLSPEITDEIKTGDYIGIYADEAGLDVTHVGIAIRTGSALVFRHASSLIRSVVDQDLVEYVHKKPGVVVLRPVSRS